MSTDGCTVSMAIMFINSKFWDASVIQQEEHKHSFLEHINKVDPTIKCTVENNKQDGAIPFLNTMVKPQTDNPLSLTVYRKPTHTDQYLQLDSHHHLGAKYSVISILAHRARIVCKNKNSSIKNYKTSGKPSPNVSTLHGL